MFIKNWLHANALVSVCLQVNVQVQLTRTQLQNNCSDPASLNSTIFCFAYCVCIN